MGQDFVEYDKKPDQIDKPGTATRVMHIKIKCPNCGNLLSHYRVENPGAFLELEAEPCQECMTGMLINQQCQIERIDEYPDIQTVKNVTGLMDTDASS